MSMWRRSRAQNPEQTVLVARAVFPNGSVAMSTRDHLGEVFTDEQFAAAFGVRGAPAESPAALALVTALQFVENLTDRQGAQMVALSDVVEIMRQSVIAVTDDAPAITAHTATLRSPASG